MLFVVVVVELLFFVGFFFCLFTAWGSCVPQHGVVDISNHSRLGPKSLVFDYFFCFVFFLGGGGGRDRVFGSVPCCWHQSQAGPSGRSLRTGAVRAPGSDGYRQGPGETPRPDHLEHSLPRRAMRDRHVRTAATESAPVLHAFLSS